MTTKVLDSILGIMTGVSMALLFMFSLEFVAGREAPVFMWIMAGSIFSGIGSIIVPRRS